MESAALPYALIRRQAYEPLRQLGLLPPAVVRASGYRDVMAAGLADSELVLQMADLFDGASNDELIARLGSSDQERWFLTLYGPDDGPRVAITLPDGSSTSYSSDSCFSEALAALFGSLAHYANYEVGGLFVRNRAVQVMHGDPEFRAAHEHWRMCMGGAGWELEPLEPTEPDFTRSYPQHLVEPGYREGPVAQADAVHRAVADADVVCQNEVGMAEANAAAAASSIEDSSRELGYDLLGRQEMLQAAVARARNILMAG